MASFFARIFGGRFSSQNSSLARSEPSLRQQSFQSNRSASTFSLTNLVSYTINPKELEKFKIHQAAWDGKLKKLQRLTMSGQINVRDDQSRTPLHLAVVKGHLDIVQYLVNQGAQLSIQDEDGRTPLIKAVLSGGKNIYKNLQICQALLQASAAEHINLRDRSGKSALHYAIEYGSDQICQLLLSSPDCDINLQDHNEMSPLHLAVKGHRKTIVALLLSDQYDPQVDLNAVNRYGQTPLHVAARAGFDEIVRLLLLSNIQPPCDLTLVDSQQMTALEGAQINHQKTCAKLIQEYAEKYIQPITPRHISESIRDASAKGQSSLTLTPAANVENSADESSSIVSSTDGGRSSLKPPAQRPKRASDQWSDENVPKTGATKGINALIQQNVLQPAVDHSNSSSSESLVSKILKQNPIAPSPKAKSQTEKKANLPYAFVPIGPVVEHSSSHESSSVSPLPKKDNFPTEVRPSGTAKKSWSDDTDTVSTKKPLPLKKVVSPVSQTWDTTSPTHTDDEETGVYKKKEGVANLNVARLLSASTEDLSGSESEFDSIQTEIRKIDANMAEGNAHQPTVIKVIQANKVASPVDDSSSWTSRVESVLTKIVQKNPISPRKSPSQSTWDDSKPIVEQKKTDDEPSTMSSKEQVKHQSSSTISALVPRIQSPIDVEIDRGKSSTNESAKISPSQTVRSWASNDRVIPQQQTISSSSHDARVIELRESIRKIEENQENTMALKRQLKEMEKEKNQFEQMLKDNARVLKETSNQLEKEKSEKQQLEWTTKNLNSQVEHIREKLQMLEEDKEHLNRRCLELKRERDENNEKLRELTSRPMPTEGLSDEDLRKIYALHQNQMKILTLANTQLEDRTKKFESDEATIRQKIDSEKSLDEKDRLQREFDRLKYEKQLIDQERLQYKIKYDCLQEEIRTILLDRSKLEQQLTTELQEQIQQRQRSTADLKNYQFQIEQMNLKLLDAQAQISVLQSPVHTLNSTKNVHSNNGNENRTNSFMSTRNLPDPRNLIENSDKIRSEASRAIDELDRLRENFDRLVSNYEPNSLSHLRTHIDIFRQFRDRSTRTPINNRYSSFERFNRTLPEDRLQATRPTVSIPRRASALLSFDTNAV